MPLTQSTYCRKQSEIVKKAVISEIKLQSCPTFKQYGWHDRGCLAENNLLRENYKPFMSLWRGSSCQMNLWNNALERFEKYVWITYQLCVNDIKERPWYVLPIWKGQTIYDLFFCIFTQSRCFTQLLKFSLKDIKKSAEFELLKAYVINVANLWTSAWVIGTQTVIIYNQTSWNVCHKNSNCTQTAEGHDTKKTSLRLMVSNLSLIDVYRRKHLKS